MLGLGIAGWFLIGIYIAGTIAGIAFSDPDARRELRMSGLVTVSIFSVVAWPLVVAFYLWRARVARIEKERNRLRCVAAKVDEMRTSPRVDTQQLRAIRRPQNGVKECSR